MRARFVLVPLLVLAQLGPALAQEPVVDPKVAEARSAFQKGAELAAEARWSDALAEFERSAALRPHATTTYNVGFCERALGRATRAKKHFAQALAQDAKKGGAELSPDLRAAAAKYRDEMRAQLATPTIVIEPSDARVSVDGRPLEAGEGGVLVAGTRDPGPGEPVANPRFVLEVDAGGHEIVVIAPDGRSKVTHEYFPPGSTKEIHVALAPAPTLVTTKPSDGLSARRTWGFVLGGVGLVALGAGTWFGLQASSTWEDAKDACPDRTRCPDDRGATLSADARTQANVATLGFAVGAASLAAGTILILSARSERATLSAAPTVGGATFRFEAKF